MRPSLVAFDGGHLLFAPPVAQIPLFRFQVDGNNSWHFAKPKGKSKVHLLRSMRLPRTRVVLWRVLLAILRLVPVSPIYATWFSFFEACSRMHLSSLSVRH